MIQIVIITTNIEHSRLFLLIQLTQGMLVVHALHPFLEWNVESCTVTYDQCLMKT